VRAPPTAHALSECAHREDGATSIMAPAAVKRIATSVSGGKDSSAIRMVRYVVPRTGRRSQGAVGSHGLPARSGARGRRWRRPQYLRVAPCSVRPPGCGCGTWGGEPFGGLASGMPSRRDSSPSRPPRNRYTCPYGKDIVRIRVLALGACFAPAQELKPIQLPAPRTEGGMPLMQALKERHSTRQFSSQTLSPQTLSNLLWAGFGINRPDGHRTAPSAMNWQEVDIYVATPSGVYVYDAKANALQPVVEGDLRAVTGVQPFVKDAAVDLVYVADTARTRPNELETSVWIPASSPRTLPVLRFGGAGRGGAGQRRQSGCRQSVQAAPGAARHAGAIGWVSGEVGGWAPWGSGSACPGRPNGQRRPSAGAGLLQPGNRTGAVKLAGGASGFQLSQNAPPGGRRARKAGFLAASLLVLAACLAGGCGGPHRAPELGEAYAGPLRSNSAATLTPFARGRYGRAWRPLGIVGRRRRFVRVRTASGIEGWTDLRQLLGAAQMDQLNRLAEASRQLHRKALRRFTRR